MRQILFRYITSKLRHFAVSPEPSPSKPGRVEKNASSGKRVRPAQSSSEIVSFAALAFGAFLISGLILILMLRNAQTLVGLGLVGNLYYVVLVPLGLSVAAFLFGVLRSYAAYTGNVAGGTLELGGPIVGFLLVVILGFKLVPDPSPFAITVFIHGEAGKQEIVLRNQGAVLLDLGADRRREAIGDRGQAYFAGIPSTFRGQDVRVLLDADGYESVTQEATVRLDGQSLYLPVRAKTVLLAGYVKTSEGRPVVGATVSITGSSTQTEASGFFRLSVPGVRVGENVTLQVNAAGYGPWSSLVAPGGNEVTVILTREH